MVVLYYLLVNMWQKIKNLYHTSVAVVCAIWFGFPGKKIKVIGITGTDGKTTTTHLTHHILKTAGKKTSMISSVYAEIAGIKYDIGFHVTTPDPWMIQKFLRQAVIAGDEYMVLEVTSHALDQNRVWGIDFEIGVLTNITHEHLDYHQNYPNYVRTKEKLLQMSNVKIINCDDASFSQLDTSVKNTAVTYGKKSGADITPQTMTFISPLPGEYNEYNCLAAIAVAKEIGINHGIVQKALNSFSGVKGRYEKIKTGTNFEVIIDFAHTPNAIEQLLKTIRPTVKGKLIHVFGSAALRDVTKRPLMGEKSAMYADMMVFTEEDYRTEDVEDIIDHIAKGAKKGGAVEYLIDDAEKALKAKKTIFLRIPDRQAAIGFAIQKLAKKGDVVVLTGKAHEKSLCRGTVEYPWDEHEAVNKALKGRNAH